MNLKLFFSHAWADKVGDKVKKLQVILQKSYEVWLDKKQIDVGNHINNTVEKGIKQCDIFIIVWSQNAHNSKGVLFEMETAANLNKPMLILLIENFDIANSPYLAGKEYIDFSGDAVSFNQQEIYLQNFLLRKKIELFKQHLNTATDKAALKDIANKTEALQDVLIELEDTIRRQKANASGNDASNAYIQASLNAFEKTMDAADDVGKTMLIFAAKMKEISEKHPLKSDDNIKKQLAIKAINEIDPLGKNEDLAALKTVFEQDLGLKKNEQPQTIISNGDEKMTKFAVKMKELSEKYPHKNDEKVKKRMALKAIAEIDPLNKNEKIASIKNLFEQDLGLNKNEVTPTGVVVQQKPQKELVLIKAFKNSVEKTKQIVLDKTKSSLDSIPLFSFISSINKAGTEFEISYITNSPAILEKMYQAALLSKSKELKMLIAVLIQHIKVTDLITAEATKQIKSYMPYAYLINNTARLLVQAKALEETEVTYSLVSSLGLDKLTKFFFKEDWKEKAEKFLDMVKNNYGIEDKNLNWIKVAATVVGVALVADGLAGLGDGDTGDSGAGISAESNTSANPVYFEDKMAAMGLNMPNTVQY